jgi:hypothetical protein
VNDRRRTFLVASPVLLRPRRGNSGHGERTTRPAILVERPLLMRTNVLSILKVITLGTVSCTHPVAKPSATGGDKGKSHKKKTQSFAAVHDERVDALSGEEGISLSNHSVSDTLFPLDEYLTPILG